jgi:hypothetical protein
MSRLRPSHMSNAPAATLVGNEDVEGKPSEVSGATSQHLSGEEQQHYQANPTPRGDDGDPGADITTGGGDGCQPAAVPPVTMRADEAGAELQGKHSVASESQQGLGAPAVTPRSIPPENNRATKLR